MNATEYLKHWEANKVWTHYKWPKHQKRFRVIASMCEGKNCIDVGCGLGHSTRILSRLYPATWTGLEFDLGAIMKAKKVFHALYFLYAKDYDLKSTCPIIYDTVVCSEVIEHVEDDTVFVKELMAIAGIKLVLTTPNRTVDDPGHLRLYTPDMIEDLLGDYNHRVKSEGGYYYMEVER